MSYSLTVLSFRQSASNILSITKRKKRYSGCFFLLCSLRALLEPNFLSHLEQGSSRWFFRLCLLKTLAFWKSFLHTLQVRVTWSTTYIIALCSRNLSPLIKVFPHSMQKQTNKQISVGRGQFVFDHHMTMTATYTLEAYLTKRTNDGISIKKSESFLQEDLNKFVGGRVTRSDVQILRRGLVKTGGTKQFLKIAW